MAGHVFYLLLNCVLECLCGAELRGARGIDVNRLSCARIPTLACRACLRCEDAKTCYRYFVTALEARDDRIDNGLNCALSIGFRRTENTVNLVDNICFVHEYLLLDNPTTSLGVWYEESIGNAPYYAIGLYKRRG